MGDKTKIEWTDASWTPIRARHIEIQSDGSGKERIGWHCEHASDGCRGCYAESMNKRLGTGLEFKPINLYRPEREGYVNGEAKLFLDEEMLLRPLRWKKPRQIFVCSMTDLFASFVPDEWIDKIFAVMALAPQHTFQVLTKRAGRMQAYFSGLKPPSAAARGFNVCAWAEGRMGISDEQIAAIGRLPTGLPNVWLGVSVEDRKSGLPRIDELRTIPAALRFLSVEPLLEDLGEINLTGIGWVIAGGESGTTARPAHPDWFRSLRDQCAAAGIPFFFKQWGEWAPAELFHHDNGKASVVYLDHDTQEEEWPSDRCVTWDRLPPEAGASMRVSIARVGKKRAGRLLDGVEHNGMPGVAL